MINAKRGKSLVLIFRLVLNSTLDFFLKQCQYLQVEYSNTNNIELAEFKQNLMLFCVKKAKEIDTTDVCWLLSVPGSVLRTIQRTFLLGCSFLHHFS